MYGEHIKEKEVVGTITLNLKTHRTQLFIFFDYRFYFQFCQFAFEADPNFC